VAASIGRNKVAKKSGTNYAIRDGRRAAALVDAWLERNIS
jgi:hypothetical protein